MKCRKLFFTGEMILYSSEYREIWRTLRRSFDQITRSEVGGETIEELAQILADKMTQKLLTNLGRLVQGADIAHFSETSGT